jgi:hypothetical protein
MSIVKEDSLSVIRLILATILTPLMLMAVTAQQKEIDSIKQILNAQTPLEKVKSLNELSWYYKNFDSLNR